MRKVYLKNLFLSVAVLLGLSLKAQTMQYTFAQSSGTYTPITGGTSWQSGTTVATDAVSSAITLPFTFMFNGVAQTEVIISNNGFITFGSTAPAAGLYNPISATTAYAGAIAGYGLNLRNSTVAGAATDISYATVGTSPNREFVVQFTDLSRNAVGATERMSFQIRLAETTNTVNIVYGSWTTGSTTTTASSMGVVGLRGSSNTIYNERMVFGTAPYNTWASSGGSGDNGTASQTNSSCGTSVNTVRFNTTYLPTSGQTYTWIPIGPSMYQTLPYSQNFESAWTNHFAIGDKPANGIITFPATGNQSVRASDVTTANAVWSTVLGSVVLGATQQTRAARFHDYNAVSTVKGYMDIYLDMSGVGTKTLTFDYINTSGTDNCKVYLSTDGGLTFGSALATYTTAAAWTSQTLSLGSTTSSTCILRYEFTGACGSTDIYIDNINVFVPVTPTISSFTPNADLCTSGGQTVTITGTNLNGTTAVTFNGVNATSFANVNATTITAVTPSSLTAGTIAVTTAGGTATSAAYTTLTNPSVTASVSTSQYCGYGSIRLEGAGGTTYKWSPVTELYLDSAGTTAYTAGTASTVVYAKPTTSRTYIDTGFTSGCSDTGMVALTLGKKVTISSVTAQSPSVCSGGTDSITVVATVAVPVSSYSFLASSGTFTPISGGTSVATSTSVADFLGDTKTSINLPIGFNFKYEGISYSNLRAMSDGYISFNLASTSSLTNNLATGTARPCIAPLWDDLDGASGSGSASYITTGTPGSRIFTIEWLNWQWNYAATGSTISFQIKLYEADGKIEFIYRPETGAVNSGSASIGLAGGTSGVYLSLNGTGVSPTASSSTETTSLSTKPAAGQVYTFTPPPSLTYAWTSLNPSNTLIDNTLSTAVATVNATGKYQIVVSETGGCSALDSSLSIALGGGTPAVTITPSNVATVCPATSVTLTSGITGGCGPFTYAWSTGSSTANIVVNPTSSSSYSVTVTDNTSQTASATISINVFAASVPSISPATGVASCGTLSATLTASGGGTYAWSVAGSPTTYTGLYTTAAATTAVTGTTNNTATIYAKPTNPTTYTVTVTDANSCTASTSKFVNVLNQLVTYPTQDATIICLGNTVNLRDSATMTYGVKSYMLSTSNTTYTPITGTTVAGAVGDDVGVGNLPIGFTFPYRALTYTVFGVNSNGYVVLGDATATSTGGSSNGLTAVVNYIAPFWDDNYADDVKYITTGTAPNRVLTVQYTNLHVGGSGSSTNPSINYQILFHETTGVIEFIYGNISAALSSPTATIGISGGSSAYLNLDNSSSNPITSSTTSYTSIATAPVAGQVYTFTPIIPTFTYNWATPTINSLTSTNTANTTINSFVNTESFYVTATEINSGCAKTDTLTVTLSTSALLLDSITNSNPNLCKGDSAQLKVYVSGGCAPYTYSWSNGVTTQSTKVIPTVSGRYDITVTDQNSNSVTAQTAISVNNPQPASTANASRCGLGTLTLTANRTTATDSIRWYTASTGGVAIGNGNLFTTPVLNPGVTTYYVAEEEVNGAGTTGKLAPVAADGNFITTNWGIVFDVITATQLRSVDIYSTTAGTVDIKIMNAAMTTELFSTGNVAVSAGGYTTPNTIPLNYTIAPGTGYRMLVKAYSGINLARGGTGVSYPYNTGVVNVTSSEWGGTTTSTNYFFYNLQYGSICAGTRVPVTATVTPSPSFDITAGSFVCSGNSKMLTTLVGTADFDQVTWSPVTNLFTDAACTVPYVTGTHSYTVYSKPASASNILYTATATNTTTLCGNVDTARIYTNNIVAATTNPAAINFTGYTGANLSTVFPAWSEATGQPTPTGTISSWLNTTGLGGASNVTAKINLFSTGKKEWIVGPKFNVSSCSFLSFDAAITDYASTTSADPDGMTGTDDSVNVMISTDCGFTWTQLMSFNKNNQPSFALSSYTYNLSAYNGMDIVVGFYATEGSINDAPDYDFHLDNISIENKSPIDAAVYAIASPAAGSLACGSITQPVIVTLKNASCQTLTSIPVSVAISGPVSTTLSSTWTGSLAAGATTNFTVGNFNMSAGGTYTFVSTANVIGDTIVSNNSIITTAKSSSPNFTLALAALQICPPSTTTLSITGISGNDEVFTGTNNTSVSIVDNNTTGVNSTINITAPVAAVISTTSVVKVTLNIDHEFDADLDLFLVDPTGTKAMELSTDNGSSGINYTNTILTTAASTSITTATAPMTGTFAPEGTVSSAPSYTNIPAASLIGAAINGGWKLYAFDDASGDVGTINNWSLEIVTPSDYSYTVTGNNASPLTYSGTYNTNATTTLSPTTNGNNQYIVSMTNGAGCTFVDTATLFVSCSSTWLGTTSTDWNTVSNWSFGVPNSCANDVVIPAGTPNEPIISSADIQVGDVTIGNGVDITLQNSYRLKVCGDWSAGNATNATVVGGITEFNGTSAQTISGNTQFDILRLNNSTGAALNGTASINTRVELPSGNFNSSAGRLIFLSTSDSHCATIDLTSASTGAIIGNIETQRFVPVAGNNQHYFSSPVNSVSFAQYGASGSAGYVVPQPTCDETQLAIGSPYGTVFQYHEDAVTACSLEGWEVKTSGNAQNAKGYSIYKNGGAAFSLTGPANQAATITTSGYTNSGWSNTTLQGRVVNSGWSLVGNPYLSTVNLDGTHPDFDAQAQVWHTSGPYTGTYQPVMMGGGSAFIPPHQGFMIHKTVVGGTASFDVTRSECVNSTATFYRQAVLEGKLGIKVSGNNYNDYTTVQFNSDASATFDPMLDANKLEGNFTQPYIASEVGNVRYSINSLKDIASTSTVPVVFKPGVNGTYTLSFDNITTFDPTVYIFLEDKKTGAAWLDLRTNATYTFASTTADNINRFVLHFTPLTTIVAKDATCAVAGKIDVSQVGTSNWNATVKDNQGNVVAQGVVNSSATLTVNPAAIGNYTVTLIDANGYTAVRNITVNGVAQADANFNVSTSVSSINQSIAFSTNSNSANTYVWNFGDGNTANVANTAHTYSQVGTFNAVLTVTTPDGCVATSSRAITVLGASGVETIDKDNVNVYAFENKVIVKLLDNKFVGANVQVFNLLGQEILKDKLDNNEWSAIVENVQAAFVVVTISNKQGETYSKKVLITNK